MLGKKAMTQFIWLGAVIAFLAVALTGDRTLYNFAGGVGRTNSVVFGLCQFTHVLG
ncbi:hypothetical protein ACFLXV_01330 [Chloroflexota bacterium]